MKILKKIKQWFDEYDIEGVAEFERYKLKVTLTNGEVIESYSRKYHNIRCSYSEYRAINLDKGIMLLGKLYPQHMIKHMEDEVVDTQIVCVCGFAYGLGGLELEEIEDNQKRYSRVIEKYKRMNSYV